MKLFCPGPSCMQEQPVVEGEGVFRCGYCKRVLGSPVAAVPVQEGPTMQERVAAVEQTLLDLSGFIKVTDLVARVKALEDRSVKLDGRLCHLETRPTTPTPTPAPRPSSGKPPARPAKKKRR